MIYKLKVTPAIYLVGFMASGKTTVGRLLADRLGWHFIDLDETIEQQQKTTIAEIFDTLGEEEFRRMETNAIRTVVHSVCCGVPTVVALGGGAFARAENFTLVEDHGVSVFLDCPLETVKERVQKTSHRPLARDMERFEQLYQDRAQVYCRADYTVKISCDDPEVAVRAIEQLPLF